MYSDATIFKLKGSVNYPIVLEIYDTTDTVLSTSYYLHLEIDSERQLWPKRYDLKDDDSFPIVNFPFHCSSTQVAPAYIIYIYIYMFPVFTIVWGLRLLSWFPL